MNNIDATSYSTGQTTIYPSSPRGFVKIDITSAASTWKSCLPTYGVVIWATNENIAGRDTRFASNADSDSAQHAYILLICNSDATYTPPTSITSSTGGGGVTLIPPRAQ